MAEARCTQISGSDEVQMAGTAISVRDSAANAVCLLFLLMVAAWLGNIRATSEEGAIVVVDAEGALLRE